MIDLFAEHGPTRQEFDHMARLAALLLARLGGSATFNAREFDQAMASRTPPVVQVWRDDAYLSITVNTDQGAKP